MNYLIHENLLSIDNKEINKQNLFIVIHSINNSLSAFENTQYIKANNLIASHYYIDNTSIIWCLVKPNLITQHCGTTGTYLHKFCRNSNSIGVVMCSNEELYSDKLINTTSEFIASLMKEYNIPISNVLRHYDVNSKCCPKQFVINPSEWNNFKQSILNYYNKL